MSEAPCVSVIIPAYNAQACLVRAIRSVQAQTCQDFEIIVVDDASTDGTADLVETLAAHDGRIKLVRQAANAGPSAARNAGFAVARGTWLAILDADDAFKPERLASLVEIATSLCLDMVMDGIELFDAEAPGHRGEVVSWFENAYKDLTLETYLANDFTGDGFGLSICKPLFRRTFIEAHRLRYPTAYRHGEDSFFYTLVMIHGAEAAVLREAMYVYTTSIGRISGKRSPHTRTIEDYALKAQSVADLLADYGHRLSPEARHLMRARRERIFDRDAFWKLRRAIGRGNLVSALSLMCARPRSAIDLARTAIGSLTRRARHA